MARFALTLALSAATALVAACGGRDGGATLGPSRPPMIASGVFKDANVAGLEFESGGASGVTGSDGSFTYEVGEPVTFSIGSVLLGTVAGADVITPVDLVPNGTTATRAVQNIVRFLLMLDADGDPDNGIQISAAVRARASAWPAIDFDIDNFGGDVDVLFVQADAQSADAGTHLLPDQLTAQNHLESTLSCVFSGVFLGNYAGTDTGEIGVLVLANTGIVGIFGVSDATPTEAFLSSDGTPLDFGQGGSFVSGPATTGAIFEGRHSSANLITGTWSIPGAGESGTFSASRIGSADDAAFRIAGAFSDIAGSVDPEFGYFAFDLDAAS